MAYTLYAILLPSVLATSELPWLADSRIVPLEQGISMIPITSQLYEGLVQQTTLRSEQERPNFRMSPRRLVGILQPLSQHGTVAYVEAECWAGDCEQGCIVWKNGKIVLGPLEEDDAINQALRRLGVEKQSFYDEFAAVGLGRHRSVEDWINGGFTLQETPMTLQPARTDGDTSRLVPEDM